MLRYRKHFEVVGYAYDADLHCLSCADASRIDDDDVRPVFLGDEGAADDVCGDCFEKLVW